MTYCVAIKLKAGLDQISTFRKMIVYEKPDDGFMVLLSAGKCALVSMDSTLKSNLSVGLPLDMVIYEDNPYFRMLHGSWGQKLHEVFDSIEDPMWNGEHTQMPLMVNEGRNRPLRKIGTPQEKLI